MESLAHAKCHSTHFMCPYPGVKIKVNLSKIREFARSALWFHSAKMWAQVSGYYYGIDENICTTLVIGDLI